MIKAASDIWSSPMPRKDITRRLMIMVDGISDETTSPVLRPRVTSMTNMTMATA